MSTFYRGILKILIFMLCMIKKDRMKEMLNPCYVWAIWCTVINKEMIFKKKTNKQGNDIKISFKDWRMNVFYTLRVKNCEFPYHSSFEVDEREKDHEKYPNFFMTLPSRGMKEKEITRNIQVKKTMQKRNNKWARSIIW